MPSRLTAHRLAPILAGLLLLPAAAASAAGGIDRFQHGGRATAQVGALTARADEPSAVTYNPAAITRLGGLQLQGGLDYSNSDDEYTSSSGTFSADHTIQFPPSLYLTWRPKGPGRFAYGLGIDTPSWYRIDWNPALFPGRFLTRNAELRLFEVHPVVAFEIDDRWSVGGGLRYLFGTLEDGFNGAFTLAEEPQLPFEAVGLADADVSDLTFDLAVHYDATVWGWGAVYRHGASFEEESAFAFAVRDLADQSRLGEARAQVPFDRASQRFDYPWQLATGAWIAPYPELRVELDLVLTGFSGVGATPVGLRSPGGDRLTIARRRDWDDTLSLRLGVEGDLTRNWSVGGGVAYEPTPVPDRTLEPGFPRSDALVYGAGFSYRLPTLSIDAGYSFHDFDSRTVGGQELAAPTVVGTYSAHEQVWSISARWKL